MQDAAVLVQNALKRWFLVFDLLPSRYLIPPPSPCAAVCGTDLAYAVLPAYALTTRCPADRDLRECPSCGTLQGTLCPTLCAYAPAMRRP
eukprot:3023770-Rhodomonas_salina.2